MKDEKDVWFEAYRLAEEKAKDYGLLLEDAERRKAVSNPVLVAYHTMKAVDYEARRNAMRDFAGECLRRAVAAGRVL